MRLSTALFALSLSAPLALAHQGHEADAWRPVSYAEKLQHAPRPLPDRVILTWAGDPATTQAVTWRTDTSIVRAVAELAVATDLGRALQPTTITARTELFTSDLGDAHYHSARFVDLAPDTLYAYRVGDGVNWTEWSHFRTASREAKAFSFVYFGDAQNDIRTHWSRVFREAFRSAPRAAFTLHAGDLINNANRDAQWGEWHGAPGWVNATIPAVPTPGNHEYYAEGAGPDERRRWLTKSGASLEVTVTLSVAKDAQGQAKGFRAEARTDDGRTAVVGLDGAENIVSVDAGFTALTGWSQAEVVDQKAAQAPFKDRIANPGVRTVSRNWRPQFTLPENGPAGLAETAYWFDYQGVRIVSLNSNERQEEQVEWLRGVLKNNPCRWTILTFHHPVFSPANDRDNQRLRELWKPVIDEFKVDLVLTGHDHTYARSGLSNVPTGYPAQRDVANGTVYVVSVSGPKMYNISSDAWAVRTAEDTQLYQVISVDEDEIRFEARTATGRLYDAFTLKKHPGQTNELIESLPPLRRRPADTKSK